MKTLEQLLEKYEDQTFDGRGAHRLAQFVKAEDLPKIGLSLVEGAEHNPIEFTRENVLKQLEQDVAFGFEKALNKRGISAGLMFEVVVFWNNVLEEGLENLDSSNSYPMYGLPLFKATAVKYGFPNPIGDDSGSEHKYNG